MVDETAFLRQILAENNWPNWLVFADWLEEAGRCPEAEYIRVWFAMRELVRRQGASRLHEVEIHVLGLRVAFLHRTSLPAGFDFVNRFKWVVASGMPSFPR